MNLKPYLTPLRVIASLSSVFALVLAVSWVAGQCRQWSTPKPFPPLVDVGTPVAGPSSQAPTVTTPLEIARPALTVAELREAAKKYGLELTTKSRQTVTNLHGPERRQLDASADVLTQKEAGVVAEPQTFPMFLGEERFVHAPSGVSVDVAAWLAGFGERVDLRARFAEWKQPAAQKIPVCQTGGFLRNEAKWEKEFGAGALVTPDGIGPGGYGSVVYRGPSTGSANWGLRGMVAAGQVGGEMTGYGLVAGKVSW